MSHPLCHARIYCRNAKTENKIGFDYRTDINDVRLNALKILFQKLFL